MDKSAEVTNTILLPRLDSMVYQGFDESLLILFKTALLYTRTVFKMFSSVTVYIILCITLYVVFFFI